MTRCALAQILPALAVASAFAAPPAQAQTCLERFTDLYMQVDQGVSTRAVITTSFAGAPPTTNEFLFLHAGHYMTVPISPEGPWVLGYGDALWQSSDEGASWTRIRDTDGAANAEQARAAKRENAETIRNAACNEVVRESDAVSIVAADITVSQGMVTENRYTYVVRDADGFIVEAIYETEAPAFTMTTTQVIERAPDLSLPTPE